MTSSQRVRFLMRFIVQLRHVGRTNYIGLRLVSNAWLFTTIVYSTSVNGVLGEQYNFLLTRLFTTVKPLIFK